MKGCRIIRDLESGIVSERHAGAARTLGVISLEETLLLLGFGLLRQSLGVDFGKLLQQLRKRKGVASKHLTFVFRLL